MTVIRRRKPQFQFVQLLNAITRDYRVSWRARGLLAELLSYPADYETSVDDLVKKAKSLGGNVEGRDAMRSAAKELKRVGYIVTVKHQDARGRWVTDLEVTDEPMYELIAAGLADSNGILPGHTDDGIPGVGSPGVGSPAVGEPGVITNTEKKREGEDGNARPRANGDPSPGGTPAGGGGGLRGGRRPAGISPASYDLIAHILDTEIGPEVALSDAQWTDLAARADAMRAAVEGQERLDWEEYTAWLHQGWYTHGGRTPTFRDFVGAMRWRLSADRLTAEAWAWAAERRGAQEGSGPQGGRTPEPFDSQAASAGVCGVHKTQTTSDGLCLACEHETRQQEGRWAPEDDAPGQDQDTGGLEAAGGDQGEEEPSGAGQGSCPKHPWETADGGCQVCAAAQGPAPQGLALDRLLGGLRERLAQAEPQRR